MKRLPSFFALRALEAAARHGSYTAAARELAVTQGAISQQIRKLEAEFGTRLFHRRGNEMIPTQAAARLAEEVRGAAARLQAAVDEIMPSAEQAPLVLSVTEPFAALWLAPKLPRLLADPAGANLDIRVEARVSDFASDGVDAGIRAGRGDWPELEAERLTTERLWVVCSPEFAARHPIRHARDLLDIPLIDSHDRLWPLLFDRYGLRTPAPAPSALSSNDSILVLDAVARGLGAAMVRASMVEEELRAGRLVRPIRDTLKLPLNFIRPGRVVRFVREGDPEPAEIGYFLVWPKHSRKQARIHALRDWLLAEAASLAAEAALWEDRATG
ncbi:MAG TPA: LysR substrate-binding domain-containing protein [Allosphingosinicella sp.]|nr:LysR substrate-binding domain-containing protein [Allosphingosinicella sp.]